MAREILIGVTGGIAAYKTATLVSRLVQRGFGVSVVMTEAATHFVHPTTFAALTGRRVAVDLFDDQRPLGPHIDLADETAVYCIAPATANCLAKTAHGVADDLVSTLYLSFEGPVVMAPAMNTAMWQKPAVQRNAAQLKDDGVRFVGPETGWLSCRREGAGRMADPETILQTLLEIAGSPADDS